VAAETANSIAGIATRLRAARPKVRIPARTRDFIFSETFRRALGAQSSFYSMDIGVHSWGLGGRGVMSTHLPLEPGLRTSGATPIFPLYAFMPWTGATFIVSLKLKFWGRKFIAGK